MATSPKLNVNNLEEKENATLHFNCRIQFETELPQGDKSGEKYDALSLFIIEYHPSQAAKVGFVKMPLVEVITLGKFYQNIIFKKRDQKFF